MLAAIEEEKFEIVFIIATVDILVFVMSECISMGKIG